MKGEVEEISRPQASTDGVSPTKEPQPSTSNVPVPEVCFTVHMQSHQFSSNFSTSRRKLRSWRRYQRPACVQFDMRKRFHSSSQSLNPLQYTTPPNLIVHRHVIANDLSPSAADAMRRNVELNGLMEPDPSKEVPGKDAPAYVKINEGDAWYLIFSMSSFLPETHLEVLQVLLCIVIVQSEIVWT